MADPKLIAVNSSEDPALSPRHSLAQHNMPINTTSDIDESADEIRTDEAPVSSAEAKPLVVQYESTCFDKRGIHWLVPAQMVSLLVAGIALAVGHHAYYQSLAGTKVLPIDDTTSAWNTARQEWKIRFGTAFAFLAKTCLATSVAIAYTQHIWATCRKKAYSVSGLDAMFSATSDIFAITNRDLASRAKIGALMVAIFW
jgi:hypothetical protein